MADEIARNVRVLTANNTDFSPAPVYCASAGNVEFVAQGGGSSGVIAVTAGQILPWKIKRLTTNTTAICLALD